MGDNVGKKMVLFFAAIASCAVVAWCFPSENTLFHCCPGGVLIGFALLAGVGAQCVAGLLSCGCPWRVGIVLLSCFCCCRHRTSAHSLAGPSGASAAKCFVMPQSEKNRLRITSPPDCR